ncbi:MAG: NAD(P)/FAD-dependent oxidoreductase [Candidatus Binatia bacterium]
MVKASSQRWAVIGGGFLGLTLAHRLAQQGKKVTVFEAAESLGGLASAWQLGDLVWDRHYHVTLLSDTALRALLRELGLEQEIQWVETRTGFYTDGQLYSLSNAVEFLRFPPLSLVDKARLALTILYASRVKNWRRLEQIPVTDWLRRWSGKRTFEKIWLPLLRAKLGENYTKASAAFIWAIIARMYAARRTGLKKEMFGYVPGGYARILDRFAEVLHQEGVDLRLRTVIQAITPERTGGVTLVLENDTRKTFDQVVLTVAAPLAVRLCPELSMQEQSRLRDVQYQGIICASVVLRKPLAGFYVTNITESWVPFTAVIEMTALVDPSTFAGKHLVYLPKYVLPDDPVFAQSDGDIEALFVAALLWMYPHLQRNDILAFRISRVRYVLAVSTLHYSDRLPPMSTSVPGLHIVNSAHIVNGTLNVNETIQLAERTVGKLLTQPTRLSTSALSLGYEYTETNRQRVAGS